MPGFGDIVQKAFYLGVGLAAYAGEKAGGRLADLRPQAQKLADELVAKGEMNTEEAKRFVEDLLRQAQAQQATSESGAEKTSSEPRRIEILSEDEEPAKSEPKQPQTQDVDKLRQQVLGLQEELQRLKRDQ